MGRGSARALSPPLQPQVIEGRGFLGVDMGTDGRRFPDRRTGLMALYGRAVPLDERRIVVFGRDISLLSEAEYRAREAPTALARFPGDLAHPHLEYSGLYEDGWVPEEAYLSLGRPGDATALALRGVIPYFGQAGFETECVVPMDGREVLRRRLGPGDFALRVAVGTGPGHARIDLRFSAVQRLLGRDSRPVAARLAFVGFESDRR